MLLPQELIDLIVDAVGDYDALNACSLVCAAFAAPAQRVLLRKIVVVQGGRRVEHRALSIQRVHATFRRSLHVPSYVRDVELKLSGLPLNDGERGPLQYILSVLSNIERLTISGSAPLRPSSVLRDLLPDLLGVLRRPTLDWVSLIRIIDVPSAFFSLAMLSARVVWIHNIFVHNTQDLASGNRVGSHASTARLEHLITRGSLSSFLDAGVSQYLQHLRTLEIDMMPGTHTAAHAVITAASSSIKNLLIDYGDYYGFRSSAALQLPNLAALRTLRLTLFLGWVRRFPPDIFATVAAFPECIPNIQRLSFAFTLDSLEQRVPWQETELFALFDVRCDYRARLPHLRQVECVLNFLPWESNPRVVKDRVFSEFRANMEKRFPGLGAEMLTFSHS
ncbi:hypothetical protein B0H16DRAFT_1688407 [Mycena metata]|uniref:F-box domain-containing protein n=1 Tax=Mycena metata TaxID=1033252 RepID=A0AAD7JEP7_9AGAR|nr:hypothetical protein B0H16DRAFT_1688407 [Mycena metata]